MRVRLPWFSNATGCVVPEAIGAGALDIDEAVGRVPDAYLGAPVDGQAVEAKAVANLGALLDGGGADWRGF